MTCYACILQVKTIFMSNPCLTFHSLMSWTVKYENGNGLLRNILATLCVIVKPAMKRKCQAGEFTSMRFYILLSINALQKLCLYNLTLEVYCQVHSNLLYMYTVINIWQLQRMERRQDVQRQLLAQVAMWCYFTGNELLILAKNFMARQKFGYWEGTLAPPGKYDWTVAAMQRM